MQFKCLFSDFKESYGYTSSNTGQERISSIGFKSASNKNISFQDSPNICWMPILQQAPKHKIRQKQHNSLRDEDMHGWRHVGDVMTAQRWAGMWRGPQKPPGSINA